MPLDFSQQYSSLPSFGTDERMRELAQAYADQQNANALLPADPSGPSSVQDYGKYIDSISPGTPPPPQAPTAPSSVPPQTSAPAQPVSQPATQTQNNPVFQAIAGKYGFGQGLDDKSLQDAQVLGNQQRLVSGLGQGLDTIARSISHAKESPEANQFYQNQMAGSDNPVKNIIQARQGQIQSQQFAKAQENLDPTSVKAAILRKLYAPEMTKLGMSGTNLDGLGAEDINDLAKGPLEFGAKQKQAEESAKAARDFREALYGDKQNQLYTKQAQSLGDALDPDKSRAGNFGQQQNIVYASNKLKALAQQFPDGNMPPAQVAELAQATANMLGGGSNGAESTIARYVPNTVDRTAAGIAQWITNAPQGAGQQAFVKQMLETGQREGALAQSNVNKIKFSRVAGFGELQKKDPATFNQVLLSHDVDPDEYAAYQKSGFKTRAPQTTTPAAAAGGKIKVSNGKSTYMIDPTDLADAQKDGFQVSQ